MGLFALLACSEDAYQDTEEITTAVENSNTSNVGGNVPFTVDPYYLSPWDQYTRAVIPKRVSYVLANTTAQGDPSKRLIFRVTPYVGLAYYDDVPNGFYSDLHAGFAVANMATPAYSNLYAGGKEVGNFIAGYPLTLLGVGANEIDMSIISDTNHCPIFDGNSGVSNGGRFFNIPPINATSQEKWLLSNYGKVFFYYWEALHPVSFAVVESGYIKQSCDESLVNTSMIDIAGTPINATIPNIPPGPTSSHLFKHRSNVPVLPPPPAYPLPNFPRSMEVTLEDRVYPSAFTFPYNGTNYIVECYVTDTTMSLRFRR